MSGLTSLDKAGMRLGMRRYSHASYAAMVVFIGMVAFLVLGIVGEGAPKHPLDSLVLATFLLNAVVAAIALLVEVYRHPFSLAQIHWLFFLVFYCVAPFSQYWFGFYPWDYFLTADTMLKVNLLLFAWAVVFLVFSSIMRGKRETAWAPDDGRKFFQRLPKIDLVPVLLLTAIAAAMAFYVIRTSGFSALLYRGGVKFEGSQGAAQIADKVFRGVTLFAFLFALLRQRQSKSTIALVIIAGISLLIVDFPASLARYNIAAIYGGLVLLLWAPLRDRRGLFAVLLLLAMLVVFPAFGEFRNQAFSVGGFVAEMMHALSRLPRGFCTGAYDAYSMFARTIVYVDEYGVTSGFQLLSAVLFFVPRSVWPDKGIGSGALIATANEQQFINVSCPLPGEFYINFGLLGMLVAAAAFGFFCARMDNWFFADVSFMRLFYPTGCMLFFFVLRGDMMSSIAFVTGYSVVFVIVVGVVHLFSRVRVRRRPDDA